MSATAINALISSMFHIKYFRLQTLSIVKNNANLK